MLKLGAVMAVALVAMIASVRADEQVWTVQSWPGDIDLIPCSAWSRTADGTWVLTRRRDQARLGGDEQYRGQGRRRGARA